MFCEQTHILRRRLWLLSVSSKRSLTIQRLFTNPLPAVVKRLGITDDTAEVDQIYMFMKALHRVIYILDHYREGRLHLCRMAAEVDMDRDVVAGYEQARAFLDPILERKAADGAQWDPTQQTW